MHEPAPHDDTRLNLRAAFLLGLVTSTFSTVAVSLGAARIGRDVGVDWMIVASLLMRDAAFQAEPGWPVLALGILIHQSADILWAVVFFGLLGRWTARLSPPAILLAAVPWALLTSAIEWFLIVPLLPFRQPAFTLLQAYWLGLVVHLLSASLYPLFPWVRDRLARRVPSPHRRFAARWGALAAGGTLLLGVLAALGSQQRELPHLGGDTARDRDYMRHMAVHHEQGIELASLAAKQAADPQLRALARLMIATQKGEVAILAQWWRSWFDAPPAFVCSEQERAAMPGLLDPARLAALRRLRGGEFDAAFVDAMSFHHRGAIAMADAALHRAGDPRLRLMSHAIVHEQRGEIALMHGVEGVPAVTMATRAMWARAGEHPADRPQGLPQQRRDGERGSAGTR
ncbi:DUF305 domain-containing protein [Caldimonas tepidiphila]|uniref:DUF305 domain-containing protein n=1 Tax=Caldimonas tepidiphila TaxID=2315841 RepID=UPI000E5A57FE|nr:DUF305 domain-containing protein [Caldimonas tepidiphila]